MEDVGDASIDCKTKLIVNYIPQSFTQEDVKKMFENYGSVANCKLVRNHQTGESMGYAFIEYDAAEAAAAAIQELNGSQLEDKVLRVNYAKKPSTEPTQANVYIAGLPTWVDENKLQDLFSPYGEIMSAKVLYNSENNPRGVGFVRYYKRTDAERAIECMAGKRLDDAAVSLTVKLALPGPNKTDPYRTKGSVRFNPIGVRNIIGQPTPQPAAIIPGAVPAVPMANTVVPQMAMAYSVYVFGLQFKHTELTLYEIFSPFGAIVSVKLMRDLTKEGKPSKGFGFVNFLKYEDASRAVMTMHNCQYDGKYLQVSFKNMKTPGAVQSMPGTTPSIPGMTQVPTHGIMPAIYQQPVAPVMAAPVPIAATAVSGPSNPLALQAMGR